MYEIKVHLPIDGWYLEGNLDLPVKAKSIIIFSGPSSLDNTQSNQIARHLQRAGFGTLLFNLMNKKEIEDEDHHVDMDVLTQRLLSFTIWLRSHAEYHDHDLAYFGFNTGGAVALSAAAELGAGIKAVVTESARTDLVMEILPSLTIPAMLIVGELDFYTLNMNRKAIKKMNNDNQLVVIPGASHALEEPGKLNMAANDAAAWFSKYMATSNIDSENDYKIVEES